MTHEINLSKNEFEAALTRAYNEGFAAGHDDGYQEGYETAMDEELHGA